MTQEFISAIAPPDNLQTPAWWFTFRQDKLLICPTHYGVNIPQWNQFSDSGLTPIKQHYLGSLNGHGCYAIEVDGFSQPPDHMVFRSLRSLLSDLSETLFTVAGRALQIINWDRNHQFCGRCGKKVAQLPTDRAKQCISCGLISYPRLNPAIIVLIKRGAEILLSRSHHFMPGMYSVQAGFVEPGETLEEAAKREILEEVGLEIKNLCYFGSQSWPFPSSLMLAFTADYANGELRFQHGELEDAGWYQIDNLPTLPAPMSIARKMINAFLASLK